MVIGNMKCSGGVLLCFSRMGKYRENSLPVSRTSFLSWLKQSVNHRPSGRLTDKYQVELVGRVNIFLPFP